MFERILIANRGEVAARVARTCRRLGIETVAVHTAMDEGAIHVAACDEAVDLGDDPAAYLDGRALLEAALARGVHAVHPGYGALAGDPAFARAVSEAGLIFVGPSAALLERAQDRLAVRATAEARGVRLLPASERPITGPQYALLDVDRIDYPVCVRPAVGFGEAVGAVAADVAELAEALAALDPLEQHGGAYVERWVERARHVEVQLFGTEGVAIPLGDREVSLRRGARRLLGESPAVALEQHARGEAIRGAMWDAAAEVATALEAEGLSSARFVLDDDGAFYFVGLTPGLEVEHAAIEMCAGVDLVELQLRQAAGELLADELSRVEPTGCATLAYVDAACDPTTGRAFDSQVLSARWPPAPPGKVRIETGVQQGSAVSAACDPLIATITTYAPNRHDAVLMLDRVLAEIHLGPVVTNQRLLRKVINHESFRAGQYDEGFVDRA
ncbi:MAG: hypothetical protein KF729_17225 [Sandaracinaceae bacterium]|nr:hypothetical protein [Sandaracinaceae bacterium]